MKPANVQQVISEARVEGTSHPDLNGSLAASAIFNSTSGRCVGRPKLSLTQCASSQWGLRWWGLGVGFRTS